MKKLGILSLIGVAAMTTPAMASITAVDYYQLGEADPGAVAGNAGNAATVDSSGNVLGANDLSKNGSPVYSSNVAASAAAATGSTLSMDFLGSTSYSANTIVTSATDNFGVEGWIKPTAALNSLSYYSLAYTGSAGNRTIGSTDYTGGGFGLYIHNNTYQGLFGNIAFLDSGVTATPGVWNYFALVRNNGVATLYINNTTAISPANDTATPNSASLSLPYTGIGAQYGGSDAFPGLEDNVRFFTFAPGSFNASTDLLIAAPEPASIALFGLGAFGLLARRRPRNA